MNQMDDAIPVKRISCAMAALLVLCAVTAAASATGAKEGPREGAPDPREVHVGGASKVPPINPRIDASVPVDTGTAQQDLPTPGSGGPPPLGLCDGS